MDKSLYNIQQPQGISETLQNYIDSMVEEIVLEGKPFDTQKKYLKKFSENEGLDYDKLEADIVTFIEIFENLNTTSSKVLEKYAVDKAKDCYISERVVKKLITFSSPLKRDLMWKVNHFADFIRDEIADFYYMSPPRYPNDRLLNEIGPLVGISDLASKVDAFIKAHHDEDLLGFYNLGKEIRLEDKFIYDLLGDKGRKQLLQLQESIREEELIHSRKVIITKITSTGICPEFNDIESINISEQPFVESRTGKFYHCRSKNSGTFFKHAQVVKIYKNNKDAIQSYNTIRRLQDGLILKGHWLLSNYPTLFAAPQCIFEGELDGMHVWGYSANDLKSSGYCCLRDVIEDEDIASKYDDIDITNRYANVYRMMRALALLEETQFIYTPLKLDDIFVSLKPDGGCAIIGFDSSTAFNENVMYSGLLAPECSRNSLRENDSIRENVYAEEWSAAVAAFYILFQVHPFGFLTQLSDKSISEYLTRFDWPNVNHDFPYFDSREYGEVAEYIKSACNSLPTDIFEYFKYTFTKGYFDPFKRLPIDEWISILRPHLPLYITDEDDKSLSNK